MPKKDEEKFEDWQNAPKTLKLLINAMAGENVFEEEQVVINNYE